MKLKITEKEIQHLILQYLQLRKVFCWRNNTAAFAATYKGKERFIRTGFVGSGDIIGLTPQGRFFSIEVKVPGRQPTFEQIQFMNVIKANNGIAFVATCLEDVQKALDI